MRHGNEAAFEALYDRHHRAILSFCRHMLASREDAEDCVQHTFAAAHATLAGSGRELSVRAWLFAVARNRCLDVLRARREVPSGDLEEASTDGLSAEVERRDDLRALLGDLGRLRDDQREALVLSELRALPHEEIAAVIGVPPTKVKALVYQARQNLALDRQARETSCAEVRETLAVPASGALRAPLRRHLAELRGLPRLPGRGPQPAPRPGDPPPRRPRHGARGLRARPARRRLGRPAAGLAAALEAAAARRSAATRPTIALLGGGGAVATVGVVEHERNADRTAPATHSTRAKAPARAVAPAAAPRPATLRVTAPSSRPHRGASTPKRAVTPRTVADTPAKARPTAAVAAPVRPASARANTPTRAAGRTDPGANARGRALGNQGTRTPATSRKAATPQPAARRPVKVTGRRPVVPPGQVKKTTTE